ncbi:helix-turn-helix domain-containing protein [Allosphingosinicella deserti]|nr:AraC family transcriptional regulator [Sphingomonas deserti]
MRHHIIGAVFSGEGTTALKTAGQRLHVRSKTDTIIINPSGTDGWWTCTGSPLVSNVFLGQERLRRCAEEVGRGGTPELILSLQSDDPKLFNILSLIARERDVDDVASKLFMEHLVDLLCLQLLRRHVTFPHDCSGAKGGLTPAQLRRVTSYIEDRLSNEIRLQELANIAHVSRFHFCRAFRCSTGQTPHQWLIRARIKRACCLLRETRLSITDIALVVGYQTASSFALAFRKATGASPTDYRAR